MAPPRNGTRQANSWGSCALRDGQRREHEVVAALDSSLRAPCSSHRPPPDPPRWRSATSPRRRWAPLRRTWRRTPRRRWLWGRPLRPAWPPAAAPWAAAAAAGRVGTAGCWWAPAPRRSRRQRTRDGEQQLPEAPELDPAREPAAAGSPSLAKRGRPRSAPERTSPAWPSSVGRSGQQLLSVVRRDDQQLRSARLRSCVQRWPS